MDSAGVIAYSFAFINIIYFIISVGIIEMNATYIRWVTIMVQTALCLYLIINFNPYMYKAFTPSRNDAYLIFWCAVLFGNNIILSELANTRLARTVQFVKSEPVAVLERVLHK